MKGVIQKDTGTWKKRFAFIEVEGRRESVFVHISACNFNSFEKGMEVEFDMGKNKKKQDCAVNCRAVSPVNPASPEFINPYNFVRVGKPEECDRTEYKVDHARFHDNFNTGKLRCRIKAISPMFIPDMTTKKECKKVEGHYEYKFFKIDQKPAIPGTSIKGMLRSVYETITNSCFSQISKEDEKITFREGGSKSTFNKNVYSTLKNFSEHLLPCRDIKKLCPACKLFGAVDLQGVNTDETVSLAGKIKITNALLGDGSRYDTEMVTLKILGSPHETATSFYLINEKYDNSKAIVKRTGAGYDQNPQPILRGRKYYWHQCDENTPLEKFSYEEQAEPKYNNQNATVELLEKCAEFEFDLYFENLSKEELALLIWSLKLENKMLHKLGHGKPLGLGSIKINIDYENSYLVGIKTRYLDINSDGKTSLNKLKLTSAVESANDKYCLKLKCNNKEIAAFEIKSRTNYEDLAMILKPHPELFDQIKYPASHGMGYQWFVDNKSQPLCTIDQIVTKNKTQKGFS